MAALAGAVLSQKPPFDATMPEGTLNALLAATFFLLGTAVIGFYGTLAESRIVLCFYVLAATVTIIFEIVVAMVVVTVAAALVEAPQLEWFSATTNESLGELHDKIDEVSTTAARYCCDPLFGVFVPEDNPDQKIYLWDVDANGYAAVAYNWTEIANAAANEPQDSDAQKTLSDKLQLIWDDRQAACFFNPEASTRVWTEDNCRLDGGSASLELRKQIAWLLGGLLQPVGLGVLVLTVMQIFGLVAGCSMLCRAKGALAIFDDDVDTTIPPVDMSKPEPEYPLHSEPDKEFWPFVLVFANESEKDRQLFLRTMDDIKRPIDVTDGAGFIRDSSGRPITIDTQMFKSADGSEIFVKLRLHRAILEDEAYRLAFPLRCNADELLAADVAANIEERTRKKRELRRTAEKVNKPSLRDSLKLRIPDEGSNFYPYHYIYAPYRREAKQNLYRRDRTTHTKFRQADVIKLVVSVLENRCGIILDDLAEFFPLHDRVERLKLKDKWFRWFSSPWAQPLIPIRNYFGEQIAFYFCWLGHYTKWLVAPALVGLAVYVHQNVAQTTSVRELPFYGIFIALWSTLFLEFWKRKERTNAMMWGTVGFESRESNRPDFEQFHGKFFSTDVRASPVSGLQETYYNKTVYNTKIVISEWVVGVMICIVLTCVFSIFALKQFLDGEEDIGHLPKGGAGYTAAAVNAVQIQILNLVYQKIAEKLNEWENHRTDTMYQDNLIAKVFLFQFINSYFSLFYIAFLKNNVSIFGSDIGCLTNPRSLTPDLPDCLGELQSQLGVIFATRLVVGNVTEILVPYISWYRQRRAAEKANELDDRSPAERQNNLADYETFHDYAEMVIQFGYVTLFVVAFPIAPLMALISNYVEIRVDSFKLLDRSCRPEPRGAEDIGTWYRILEIMGQLAVITNIAAVMFSSNAPAFAVSGEMRIWVFVILEHAVFFIKFLFAYFVPDTPADVELQLRRQAYLVQKHFFNVGDVVSVRREEGDDEAEGPPLPDEAALNAAVASKGWGAILDSDPTPVEHEDRAAAGGGGGGSAGAAVEV